MRMRAISSSNYTYADRDGNIYLLWNAMIPDLPHEAKTDEAVSASTSEEIWTRLLPFERLPQVLNPEGGYVQNANDPPYYTNLNELMDPDTFPSNFPEPQIFAVAKESRKSRCTLPATSSTVEPAITR